MGQKPVLRWMAGNVEILSDPAGNVKPVKSNKDSAARIDGIISSIMGLDRAIRQGAPEVSVYTKDRGIIFI